MDLKQQNSAMVDKIKALSDTKFEELSKKIDTLQDKINVNHNAPADCIGKNRSESSKSH